MSADDQKFPYEPLDPRDFSIRVLQVQPGDVSDPLSCTLVNYADATVEGWTCLSYTWGTEPPTKEITINGVPFPVRSNVYNFLRQAQRQRPMNLWIDSICINQADIDERNSQVELMSSIFSEAKLVVVWLGQSSPALERAFRLLSSGFPADTVTIRAATAQPVCCKLTVDECNSLFEACTAAIWTRRWVKQEVLLPDTVILCCGSASVSISVFCAVIDALADYSTLHDHASAESRLPCPLQDGSAKQKDEPESCFYYTTSHDKRYPQYANVLAFRHAIRFKPGRMQLPVILKTFQDSVCTDFHDHVYAFRGMIDQGKWMRVNYKISNPQIFIETLDFVARTTHPRLRGSSAAERDLIADLYRGFGLTVDNLEEIFAGHHSSLLLQVGYNFDMRRKDISVWAFADSIANTDEFTSSPWRSRRLCRDCRRILSEQPLDDYHTVLNQLRPDPELSERGVWLYGLRGSGGPSLAALRAVYSPEFLYMCSDETYELLSIVARGRRALRVMAFREDDRYYQELLDWLNEVKDHFVVMITDRDDAAYQIQISVLPSCESDECLLAKSPQPELEANSD